MAHYKLIYFNYRARAEVARQLFVLAGVLFEDVRISRDKWRDLKPDTPFGALPVLEVDGQPLAQSNAIYRFLARQFGYAGKSPIDEAQVDALVEQYDDYYEAIIHWYWILEGYEEGDEVLFSLSECSSQLEMRKAVAIPARDQFCAILKKMLSESDSGYLIGSSLTYADLRIANHVFTTRSFVPDFFDDYPELISHMNRVYSSPKLDKWLTTRPETAW